MILHYYEKNKQILEKCPYISLYTHFNLLTWVFMNSRHHLASLTTLDNVTFYGIPHPHFDDPAAGLNLSSETW